MSGSTIGGAIGAVVGFYVGGPQGAQWGWMIGSTVGGYVDPTQIEGPRLQDARTQTSRDGIAIPFGWGTFPLAGNVIAQGPVVEHKKKERQGKGGPEVTTYSYTRTYAIGLCEGPITGLLQIKRNGKVVYDARADAVIEEELARGGYTGLTANLIAKARASNSAFINKAAIYLGDETQMPDPALEAIFGAGNVPAHRGLAYFVVEDDDVTDLAGAIPQYEVVVAGAGVATQGECGLQNLWAGTGTGTSIIGSERGDVWDKTASPGVTPLVLVGGGGALVAVNNGAGSVSYDRGGSWESCAGLPAENPRYAVYYPGNGGIWLVSYESKIYASSDAKNYTLLYSIPGGQVYGGACSSSAIVFGTTSGRVLVSTDHGASFAFATAAVAESFNISHVCWTGTRFIAASYTGSKVSYSETGATWTPSTKPAITTVAGLSAGGGAIVAVDTSNVTIISVDGGESFSYGPSCPITLSGSEPTRQIEYANGAFYAGGSSFALSAISALYDAAGSPYWGVVYGPNNGRPHIEWVVSVGYNNQAGELPDAPGYYVTPSGQIISSCTPSTVATDNVPLSTIVADVCERRGLVSGEYDVSQLTDMVTGFVVGRETDAASIIQSLAPAYFFDPGEWDGKLRFIKRGGTAVGAINGDDLVERDGDAFERERVQEAELLRRVTVGYNDPQAAYALTTQKWERRAGTVQALGEASVELPLTLEADDAATIAKRRGLVAWGEPEKQKFSLPYRLSKYTPTDIITYTDDDGLVHTIRLMDMQDDSGARYVESSMNSAEAYGATATGVVPRPPSITDPALRGPTLLAVMDLPLWRSGDADTLGLYVAGCGYLAGWQGAQVDVSTDGGVSYSEAAQVTVPATIGTTTTALAAWVSSEHPSVQSVTVTLPDAPESVSYESLLRYNNRAALRLDDGSWEILQYQTVVANGNDSYTLSGLARGRYATTPGAAASGATFVLLDAAVQFVPVERHLLGSTFKVRATTYGTSSDAAVASDFAFTAGASQAEWPVHGVTATRDVSDNVTVAWIGRARLGTETVPYHSTNFAGYRVSWDDGVTVTTADTTDTTYTITSAADPIDVSVTPLNSITGAGPASEAITV